MGVVGPPRRLRPGTTGRVAPGGRRRVAGTVDDHLQSVVAHADGDVAVRDPVEVQPGRELAVDEGVERQTRREVVIGRVQRDHAAASTAAAAAQVVVVVPAAAAAASRPVRPPAT